VNYSGLKVIVVDFIALDIHTVTNAVQS